jgi:hypothetical protein
MFTISMLRARKKIPLFAKTIHILSSTWNLLFKLLKIKGLIKVLASELEKHNYINLVFETNVNNSF